LNETYAEVAVVWGFLAASLLAAGLQFPLAFLRSNSSSPALLAASVIAVAWTLAGLIMLAIRSESNQIRAYCGTLVGVSGFTMAYQGLAAFLGLFGGPSASAPAAVQALDFGLALAGILGLFLLLYIRLESGGKRLARQFLFLVLVLVFFATIVGDQYQLAVGLLTFNNGYSVATDILYGEFIFVFPVALYELLLRRAS
jgi:hypothetical protein